MCSNNVAGADKSAMTREKGMDLKELQHREGVAIVRALREKADWCHNNNGNRTFEDWEAMDKWLLEIADRLEGLGFKRDESKNYERLSDDDMNQIFSLFKTYKQAEQDADNLLETYRLLKRMDELLNTPALNKLIERGKRRCGLV